MSPSTPGEQRLQTDNYPLVTGRSYDLPFETIVDAVETVLDRRSWDLSDPIPTSPGKAR